MDGEWPIGCLRAIGGFFAGTSGIRRVWEEESFQASALLSARWLVLAVAWWCGITGGVTGWPDGKLVSIAADTLGASLGTATAGTLATEVIVVLAKLLLEGKRQKDQDKRQKDQEQLDKIREEVRQEFREEVRQVVREETREDTRDRETRVRQLEELLEKNGIEVPPNPSS